jgi:hypothetical protein
MTNQEVIENNKLIAEFMNLPLVPCNIGTENGIVTEGYLTPHIGVPSTLDGMQYKYKWDWIMPVVQKISQIEGVYDIEEFLLIRDELATATIELVYQEVVNFIKYWNDQS